MIVTVFTRPIVQLVVQVLLPVILEAAIVQLRKPKS
jgi:hypothetical protein